MAHRRVYVVVDYGSGLFRVGRIEMELVFDVLVFAAGFGEALEFHGRLLDQHVPADFDATREEI